MLYLYNTLSKKKEEFKPQKPPEVSYYSCGPTVYDYAHIGHARTYIFADILHRVLEFNGYQVKRVMNITDVGHLTSDSDTGEDKMEKKAKSEKKDVYQIAKYYTDDFFTLCEKLNIKKPETIIKATDYIAQMIDLVKTLEKKGFTYKISDGIYFDTSKFSDYGKLTGQSFEKLQNSLKAGARVEMVEGKKNLTDFALWKLSKKDENRQMEWDSPWGVGFPGWHIECSAMSMVLGESIDIHTGGVEHIPVHHTNEIAQSEAATGKKFVKYWLHADHLLVDGQKMSKSLGNFYRLKDIEEKGFDPLSLRYLFLTSSYRIQMNFTWESLKSAQNGLDSLKIQLQEIQKEVAKSQRTTLSSEKLEKIDKFRKSFLLSINDDLNCAKALSLLREVIKSNIPATDKWDLALLFDEVFALNLGKIKVCLPEEKIPKKIKKLVEKREEYRQKKNFKKADEIREKIEKQGFIVKDTSKGAELKIKNK